MKQIKLSLRLDGYIENRQALKSQVVEIDINIPDTLFEDLNIENGDVPVERLVSYSENRLEEVLTAAIQRIVWDAEEEWGAALAHEFTPYIQEVISIGPMHHPTRDDYSAVERIKLQNASKQLHGIIDEVAEVAKDWPNPFTEKSLFAQLLENVVVSDHVSPDKFHFHVHHDGGKSTGKPKALPGSPCACNPRCYFCQKTCTTKKCEIPLVCSAGFKEAGKPK